jgi:hypothetical protein
MAIIYTYPVKTTPSANDLILISDSEDSDSTKQVKVSTLPFTNNAGTVTSVGLSMPSAFEVGNSPVTSSGTISVATVGGSAGQYLAYDGTWSTPAGGAANAAGADTQVQYNDGGTSFGAGAFFTTNKSSKVDIAYELGLKGDGGSNQGLLKLYCEAGTAHHVGLKGPNHTGGTPGDYTLQFPNSLPSVANQILESNASGTLSWIATPTGGGTSYQAGNGIDIDTSTNPDTLKTGLAANGGLVFDTSKMKVDLAATSMSGELRPVDGGTGLSVYAVGDLLYAETTTTLGTLNVGTNDKILGVNNGATAPQWITNLVGQEVVSGYMLIGNGTSALTQLDTTTKGTIAVGNASTTTSLAVGTNNHVLTARSSATEGIEWSQMSTAKMSDYEVGSWTPTAYASTGAAPSTGTCVGYYERIGEIVVVHFYLPITSSSASNVTMMIGGLPYTGVTGNGYLGGVSLYANNGTNYLQQQAVSGMVSGAYINLYRFTNTGSSTDFNYTAASWYAPASLTYTIAGTATYRKA